MPKISSGLSLLLIIGSVYWSFHSLMPQRFSKASEPQSKFSTERALVHVKAISTRPHFVGSPEHAAVRDYIISDLRKLGLDPHIQEGFMSASGNWGGFCKAQNILARIPGTEKGKPLLLLSHYDSAPHSSLGAGDDGCGVATILESTRALLAAKEKTKNDIIILFSDGEELGLNGARLFVNAHPWAKDVGLVLNFEARGSGGPSFMFLETNKGNATLVKKFAKANPRYPASNSLAYSIYKLLPNDTDLTVFREEGDIDGFNFAFIDDHFDYHTAKDAYERLDRNTLEHQGTYLMPLLKYFGNENLETLKSDKDYVYFSFPFLHLVYYPFSWIVPMLLGVIMTLIALLIWGIKKGKLSLSQIGAGFVPFLGSFIICGAVGYFAWPLLLKIYPQYKDIQQEFTYNGHWYIAAFVFLSIGVCFYLYSKFKKLVTVNLAIAPLIFWLLICAAASVYLKGAGFFIIPVFFGLLSLCLLIKNERPKILLLTVITIPALLILSPFPDQFPVALGLPMLIAATLFTVLIFGILVPVFGFYERKKALGLFSIFLAAIFLIVAHFRSGFTPDRPHPTSLVYLLDADKQEAVWATSNHVPDNWVEQFIGKEKKSDTDRSTFDSKYRTGFTFTAAAPIKSIPAPVITIVNDSIRGNERIVNISIVPQRNINCLQVTATLANVFACKVNGADISQRFLTNKNRGNRLLTHYVSNNDSTLVEITMPKDNKPDITVFEISNDLLTNSQFSVPPRPADAMPMPFIVNDAIIVKKSISL